MAQSTKAGGVPWGRGHSEGVVFKKGGFRGSVDLTGCLLSVVNSFQKWPQVFPFLRLCPLAMRVFSPSLSESPTAPPEFVWPCNGGSDEVPVLSLGLKVPCMFLATLLEHVQLP